LSPSLLEEHNRTGLDGIPELVNVLINAVMQAERFKYQQAAEYQPTEEHKEYANSDKPKTVHPRIGESPLPFHKCGRAAFTLRN